MTESKQWLIEAQQLSHAYQDGDRMLEVLKGIDFKIFEQDTIAIHGVSGTGKSTLLNLLAGFLKPTSGRVLYKGTDLNMMSESQVSHYRNHSIGFVYQRHYMVRELSIIENVALPLIIRGVARLQALEDARQVLASVGLSLKCDCFAHQISGGQRQRAAVARALVTKPSIIFADEPTGSLDKKTSKDLVELLMQLTQSSSAKPALILVTHDRELLGLCQRSLEVADGRLVYD